MPGIRLVVGRCFPRPAWDAVIGRGGVRDVRGGVARHVAIDAAILRTLLDALGRGQRATVLLMAVEARSTVMSNACLGANTLVWVMAGDAANTLILAAAAITTAVVHLFDVVDCPVVRPLAHKDGTERRQRQAGAEVVKTTAAADDSCLPFEVTLLADRIAQTRRETAGVDDRIVEGRRRDPCGRRPCSCNSPGPWRRSQPIERPSNR